MADTYLIELKNLIADTENVESIIYTFDRGLKFAFSSDLHLHKFIIGLTDYDNLINLVDTISDYDQVLISSMQENLYRDIHYVLYKIAFAGGKALEFFLVKQDDLEEFLYKFKNLEVLKGDSHTHSIVKEDRDSSFWPIPDDYEFFEEAKNFLNDLLTSALAYRDKEYVKANLMYNDLVDKLLDQLNLLVTVKYDNGVYVDTRATGLKTYLNNEYYDEFDYITSLDRNKEFWTGIFKMARVYRMVSIELTESLSCDYPRLEDVEIMKFLRNLYRS